jgi:hypothetical protein
MPEVSYSYSSGSDVAYLDSPPHGVAVTREGRNLVLVNQSCLFSPIGLSC